MGKVCKKVMDRSHIFRVMLFAAGFAFRASVDAQGCTTGFEP